MTQQLDGRVLATMKAPGPMPFGLAFDGESLWVSDRKERKIYRVGRDDGHVQFGIAFDGELTGTAWDGTHIWQAEQTSRTLSRINPETGEIALAIKVDMPTGDVNGLCYEQGGIWCALSRLGQVRKIRETDGGFMRAFPTRTDICGVVLAGKNIFYSEPSEGLIHKMEAQTGSILISYKVGGRPCGICHDGEAFWIADQATAELRRIRF